mgnify:CR=1 FL=1
METKLRRMAKFLLISGGLLLQALTMFIVVYSEREVTDGANSRTIIFSNVDIPTPVTLIPWIIMLTGAVLSWLDDRKKQRNSSDFCTLRHQNEFPDSVPPNASTPIRD